MTDYTIEALQKQLEKAKAKVKNIELKIKEKENAKKKKERKKTEEARKIAGEFFLKKIKENPDLLDKFKDDLDKIGINL